MKYLLPSLIILALHGGCGNDPPPAEESAQTAASVNSISITAQERESFGVEFASVETQALHTRLVIPASVTFDQDRSGYATSLVAGRVRSVHADYGDAVRAGQLLATIESMDYGQLVADALSLHADAQAARSEYERTKALRSEDIGSEKLLQRAEATFRTAVALSEGARHKLAATGVTKDELDMLMKEPESFKPYLNVRAPISGIITDRNATKGGKVQPDQELFAIVNNTSVTVEGNLFQEHLSAIKRGIKVEFTTSAFPEERFSGRIDEIGAALSEGSHTLPVWCTIPNRSGKLKPNLNGELHIETGEQIRSLCIPADALIYDGSDTYVFRDAGNGVLEYVRVQAGSTYGNVIAIASGLREGDRVAASGVFMLKSQFKLSQEEQE